MSALPFLVLALAGGVGSGLRLVVDGIVRVRAPLAFPLGTTVINVSGSFLLGVLTGLAANSELSTTWLLILGTGAIGGYTTFSTASFETVRLIRDRRYWAALTNSLGMLVSAVGASALGIWIGGIL